MAEAAAAGDGGAGTCTGAAALEELMLELDVNDEMRWGRDAGLAVKGDAQQVALKRAAMRLWFEPVAPARAQQGERSPRTAQSPPPPSPTRPPPYH